MSEVAQATESKFYVVRGVGLRMTVELDDDDMLEGLEGRLLEAATKAFESFAGITDTFQVVLEAENTDIDVALIVAPKEEEDNEGAYLPVPSHVVLANAGKYFLSSVMFKEWEKRMKELSPKTPEVTPEKTKKSNKKKKPKKDNPDVQP